MLDCWGGVRGRQCCVGMARDRGYFLERWGWAGYAFEGSRKIGLPMGGRGWVGWVVGKVWDVGDFE